MSTEFLLRAGFPVLMPGLSCRVGTGIPCQARTLYSSPHPHTPSQVEVPPLPAWTPPLPSLKSLPPGLRLSLRVLPGCDSSTSPSRRWLPALRTWVMSGRLCHPSPPATVAIRTLWRRRHKHPESKATSATLGDGCQPPPSHLLGSGSTSSAYFLFSPTSLAHEPAPRFGSAPTIWLRLQRDGPAPLL